ncbi:hypothetical protein ACGF5F_26230 [Streptomyces sp. NPDC047821]|uniref:hypothetical protein n=1 Tax=Streptomyces sp. NPDC047821 TaxID=3365488 RepID=UPI00371A1315
MRFTQIIDFETEHIDELEAFLEERRTALADKDYGPVDRILLRDRDRPNRYLAIVGFASHEDAMRNNDDPETQKIAEKMAKLCPKPPVFTNCDLLEQEELGKHA